MREKRHSPPPLPTSGRSPRPAEEPPDREASSKTSRTRAPLGPFPWEKLEPVGRDTLETMRHLDAYLPHPALRHGLAEAVSSRLRELLGGEITFWLDHAHAVRGSELRRLVEQPSVLAMISASPHGPRGLLEVELGLAQGCIELLLGVAGGRQPLTPLTEIEEGVIAYLLLEALRVAQGRWGSGANLRLRLTGMAGGPDAVRDIIAAEKRFAVIELKVAADVHAGFVRLFLPYSLIEKSNDRRCQVPVQPHHELGAAEQEAWMDWARSGIRRLGRHPVALRARVARTELTGAELKSIGVGDVVVVEDLTLARDLKTGMAHLVIGHGRGSQIVAKVVDAHGRYGLAIQSFETQKEPQMTQKRAGGGEPPELATNPGAGAVEGEEGDGTRMENLRETADLLSDVPITVNIELGRVQLGADEVLALRTGQVLVLERGPGDPVDLVVNGRLIAQGELVQVEGQIGVRVVKLR